MTQQQLAPNEAVNAAEPEIEETFDLFSESAEDADGDIPPITQGKKHSPLLLIGGILLAAALLLLLLKGMGWLKKDSDSAVLDLSDTTVLAYTDMQDSISATGTVESASSTLVYSTASYAVKAVHVEVGDQVEEGQLLAELDDQNIREQIRSQQINLSQSAASGKQQLKTAQDNYNNYKSGLEQGLNTTLNSAQTQADNAYDGYIKAKSAYERYADGLDAGENTALIGAESALRAAERTLEAAEDAYGQAEDAYDEAASVLSREKAALQSAQAEKSRAEAALAQLPAAERTAEQEQQAQSLTAAIATLTATITTQEAAVSAADAAYQQARRVLDSADSALDDADYAYDAQHASYRAAVSGADNTLADYHSAMESAWDAYQTALTALSSAEKAVQEQLQTYQNTLASARIGASTAAQSESLRQLRVDLEGTQITAPCAGTVTAVYAEVGGSGAGLLFVIEDVDDLVVETSVKGYDIGEVRTGIAVVIRSDATGSERMEGILTRIAPTSAKNAQGSTDTSGEATFAAEVKITSQNTGLRIGMEAQLDYIIGEERHVLAVPYDAVYTNDSGTTCVLAALEQEDGKFLIRELEVTAGMDDDLDMAVSGAELEEGLRVINEPDNYRHLLGQTVSTGTVRRTTGFPVADRILGGS